MGGARGQTRLERRTRARHRQQEPRLGRTPLDREPERRRHGARPSRRSATARASCSRSQSSSGGVRPAPVAASKRALLSTPKTCPGGVSHVRRACACPWTCARRLAAARAHAPGQRPPSSRASSAGSGRRTAGRAGSPRDSADTNEAAATRPQHVARRNLDASPVTCDAYATGGVLSRRTGAGVPSTARRISSGPSLFGGATTSRRFYELTVPTAKGTGIAPTITRARDDRDPALLEDRFHRRSREPPGIAP